MQNGKISSNGSCSTEHEKELRYTLQINYGGTTTTPTSKEMEARTQAAQEPVDRLYIARISMYFFGIASLLPWNFFIQANEYWMYKLRDVNADESDKQDSPLQVLFPTYLAIASKVPYLFFLIVNAAMTNRISPEKRMLYPLVATTLLFVIVMVMIPINTDGHQMVFFGVTIAIIVVINIMSGFTQGAGTGIAGSFPKIYMDYYVNGMAIGGILASLAQILSIVAGSTAKNSAFIYFTIAIVFLVIACLLFCILARMEFYRYYMSKQMSAMGNTEVSLRGLFNFEVTKKIWTYVISIIAILWVTLSLFPAVVARVSSVSPDGSIWTDRLFLPVACFFLFNACDLGSRIIAMQFPIPAKHSLTTMILTISRIVFIPLLMLSNATPRHYLPIVFDSDLSFILIIFFFALTNGYLFNIVLSQAPKQVETELQEVAGTQMACYMGVGLFLGSVSSYGLVKLL